jgi:glycosyltransferase involved in cell wall biosynthesis
VRGLRVVLLVNSITMGGAEEHVRQVASGLSRRGADVTVIMPETPDVDPLAGALQDAGVRVERLTLAWILHGWRTVGRFWRLVRLLERLRTRLLHLHTVGYTGGRWAVWAARLADVPMVVCTIHSAPVAPQPLHVRLDRALQSRLVDRFVAVSQMNYAALRDDLGLPADKLVVIPNAVELENFAGTDSDDRRAVRERFGIPADAPVLGALARHDDPKGLTYLIQAMPAVLARQPSARLLLVGDGPLRANLEAEARSLGVAERVHFAGYQRDVASMLGAMDLVVLPSVREGLPLSLLEAMAAGRPVVATRVGGMPEVVVDGMTGRLVPPADPAALAEAIGAILDSPRCAEQMGEAGRARAQDFSDAAMLDRLSAVYRDAASSG